MNEDSAIVTKTTANYRLEGADGVLSLLQYLERKMLVRTPHDRSRNSSICNIDAAGRDLVELISDDPNMVDQVGRRRTMSLGSKKSRTSSIGSSTSGNDLRKKTLQIQTKRSREEATQLNLTN